MLLRHDPNWLSERVAEAGFYAAFATCDPYAEHFSDSLEAALNDAAQRLWLDLEAAFGPAPVAVIIRNSWSISRGPAELAALLRSTRFRRGDDSNVYTIIESIRAELSGGDDQWLDLLASDGTPGVPDLPVVPSFTGALRYRYALAGLSATALDARESLLAWLQCPRCSRLAGQRELRRAVDSATRRGRPITRIRIADLRRLPLQAQLLITSDDELLERVIATPWHRDRIANAVAAAWEARRIAKAKLLELREAIRRRDVQGAEAVASSIRLGDVSKELGVQLRRAFETALERPLTASESRWAPFSTRKWAPFSPRTLRVARKLLGSGSVPAYFGQSTTSIIVSLAAGRTSESQIHHTDVDSIVSTISSIPLSRARVVSIAESGAAASSRIIREALEVAISRPEHASTIVSLLGDSRSVALRYSVQARIREGGAKAISAFSNLIGLQAVIALFPNHSVGFARGLMKFVSEKKTPTGSEISLLGTYIANGIESSFSGERAQASNSTWISLAAAFARRNPQAATLLINLISKSSRADRLGTPVFEPLRRTVIRWHGVAATTLRRFLVDNFGCLSEPEQQALIKSDPVLRKLLPSESESVPPAEASPEVVEERIFELRHNPQQLRVYADSIGETRTIEAIRNLATRLPERSRDRGYLELVAAIGIAWIRPLAKVMVMGDRDAAPGLKLDAAYRQYLIPKRSGGDRTISAPAPFLKNLQRKILKTVFGYLRKHEAAFGFTVGRSIVDNATIHLGQEVVVNCDVQNCFPSVRWPLVLGVLRQDLKDRLSPAAISILVDICTMDGALPVGAPTSPALLNRVLLRSDELISAAATARQCRYSRYADDLTFSGDGRAVELLGVARRTLSQVGLRLDDKKTNVYRKGRRQIVTGLVVNERTSVPRRLRRRMRAAVHAVEHGESPVWHGQPETTAALRGRLQFTRSVNEREANELLQRLDTALGDE